jgi:hypothetical protein
LFSRGEARDYIDLAGIVASGRCGREELMALGAEADAGFDREIFARALAAVDRFPDQEFARYGVDVARVAVVRDTMRQWSGALLKEIARDRADRRDREPTIEPEVPAQGAAEAPTATSEQLDTGRPSARKQSREPFEGRYKLGREARGDGPGLGL